MVVPVGTIESIGAVAALANNIFDLCKKKPLTSLEGLDARIKAEEECTNAIRAIDEAEKKGDKDKANLLFHNFVDGVLRL